MRDLLDLDDVTPAERPNAARALARLRLYEVRSPAEPAFDAAYEMLASYFMDQGELEERSVLADFVRQRVLTYSEGVDGTYHLVTVWDGDQLAGVRDCYVDIDRHRGVCLVALAHAYVAPPWRRQGVASLLRALPISLARHTLLERLGHPLPTLVVAEMDPAHPSDLQTVVRLLAYGRSGFSVLDPQRFPYSQPELREIEGASYTALPLLGVVRPVGLSEISVEIARVFPSIFHTTHRMYLPRERVDPSEEHVLSRLYTSTAPVPLLPLPTAVDTLHRLRPLVRSAVLSHYPPGLRGKHPEMGDAAAELEAILSGTRDWVRPSP